MATSRTNESKNDERFFEDANCRQAKLGLGTFLRLAGAMGNSHNSANRHSALCAVAL
jgi:hypothetical protein